METRLLAFTETFEAFYSEQFPLVYNYIYFRVGSSLDAEDLTAEAFAKAYEYWSSFSSERGSRGAWLGGIARNVVNSHFRRSATRPKMVELTDVFHADVDIEGEYMNREAQRQLMLCVKKLPDQQRELLSMKYMLRLTNREIARITGLSESNVGTIMHRSIKLLQKKLETV